MALIDQYKWVMDALDHAELKNRAAAAAMNAARDVMNEDPATKDHAPRVKWAGWVFQNIEAAGYEMLPFLVANASVASTKNAATDDDIQFVVNSAVSAVCQRFV